MTEVVQTPENLAVASMIGSLRQNFQARLAVRNGFEDASTDQDKAHDWYVQLADLLLDDLYFVFSMMLVGRKELTDEELRNYKELYYSLPSPPPIPKYDNSVIPDLPKEK